MPVSGFFLRAGELSGCGSSPVQVGAAVVLVSGFELGGFCQPLIKVQVHTLENRRQCFGYMPTLVRIEDPAGNVHKFQVILKAEQYAVLGAVPCGAFKRHQRFQREWKLPEELLFGLRLNGFGEAENRRR